MIDQKVNKIMTDQQNEVGRSNAYKFQITDYLSDSKSPPFHHPKLNKHLQMKPNFKGFETPRTKTKQLKLKIKQNPVLKQPQSPTVTTSQSALNVAHNSMVPS